MTADLSNNAYAKSILAQSKTPSEHLVDPKVYYHHHNYAKFHFDLGASRVKTISFANHRYVTDDKREQDQLDLVADISGTFIYTLPDSDIAKMMEAERANELRKDVLGTAQAKAAAGNQQFDPNTPIVPMNTGDNMPQGMAVTGMANTFSGTQATEHVAMVAVKQTKAPDAASAALERLNSVAGKSA